MSDPVREAVALSTSPKISVVIPVYKGIRWISDCLTSLSNQTLPRSEFEVLVVFNGPDDGALAFAEVFRYENPSLQMQLLFSGVASASRARNIGTRHVRGRYVTWLDCDDWISPEYLELMLMAARDGIVPLAQIVNVMPDGVQDADNLINRSILELEDHLPSPGSFPRALSFMTCKLIPAEMARAIPFDETLRSGEDVALYGCMFARYDFRVSTIPALAGAKYYRRMSADSVSRQRPSYDFLVTQRLDVISVLNNAFTECRPEARALITSFINSQASFVRKYFNSNSVDHSRISEELVRRKFTYFPWNNWFDTVDRLVVAYNFLPYADTGAMVMAKRIREMGEGVDVVTHRMDNVRKAEKDNSSVGQPFIQRMHSVPGPAYFGSPAAIAEFVRQGISAIEVWEMQGRKYKEVYSRAMWPASHFLAAKYKVTRPGVRWVAEFSDPVQIDSSGQHRESLLNDDKVFDEFIKACGLSDAELLQRNRDVYAWTELLPYIFADELIFTNRNQLRLMLSYAPEEIRSVVMAKAIISEQPTLGPAFYELATSDYSVENNKINVAYFGQFYATRGLGEVLSALSNLEPEARDLLRLHIFTSNADSAKEAVVKLGLGQFVRINKQLPYFEFLNASKKFDYLVVNDAQTAAVHDVNPYLPSKLSDYLGAGTDIWALVEEGSVLSGLSSRYKSEIGDVEDAIRVLSGMTRRIKEERLFNS